MSKKKCNGKVKYRSVKFAHKIAAETLKSRGVQLYVYPCGICNHFHLTSLKVERWNLKKVSGASKRESEFKKLGFKKLYKQVSDIIKTDEQDQKEQRRRNKTRLGDFMPDTSKKITQSNS